MLKESQNKKQKDVSRFGPFGPLTPWPFGPFGPLAPWTLWPLERKDLEFVLCDCNSVEPFGPLGPWPFGPLGPWALGPFGSLSPKVWNLFFVIVRALNPGALSPLGPWPIGPFGPLGPNIWNSSLSFLEQVGVSCTDLQKKTLQC